MPTTPVLALPYPSGSDPADVPTDLNELATRIETVRGSSNGLASLGADGKVPAAQLPAAASSVVPLVTALPGSPTDGQEAILVDSLTNPSYQWRFRWNAGSSSPYKWECVGATAMIDRQDTAHSTSSTTYVDLSGPSLTLPRDGDYDVYFGFTAHNSTATGFCVAGPSIAGGVPAAQLEVPFNSAIADQYLSASRRFRASGTSGSRIIKIQYRVSTGTGFFLARDLVISPIRVS